MCDIKTETDLDEVTVYKVVSKDGGKFRSRFAGTILKVWKIRKIDHYAGRAMVSSTTRHQPSMIGRTCGFETLYSAIKLRLALSDDEVMAQPYHKPYREGTYFIVKVVLVRSKTMPIMTGTTAGMSKNLFSKLTITFAGPVVKSIVRVSEKSIRDSFNARLLRSQVWT